MARSIVGLAVLLLISGCSLKKPYETVAGGNWVKQSDTSKSNGWNEYYKKEKKRYFNGDVPNLGLALSGGGTRAASFSIGVLKALSELEYDKNKTKVLDDLDVISSVSGGSYASYWLYQNYYYMNSSKYKNNCGEYNLTNLFETIDYEIDEKYRSYSFKNYDDSIVIEKSDEQRAKFQRHLETNSNLLTPKPNSKWYDTTIYGVGDLISWVPAFAVNFVANGLGDYRLNTNPLRHYYQNALERTYGVAPCFKKEKQLYNDKRYLNFYPTDTKEKLTFKNIADIMDNNSSIPMPIVNMTAGYGKGSGFLFSIGDKESKVSQTVFEVTPLHYGSSAYGYVDNNDKTPLHSFPRSASISGGALNGQSDGGSFWLSMGLRTSNMGIGYDIDNHHKDDSNSIKNTLSNLPLVYIFGNFNQDIANKKIHLSDGGGAENLGAFSLIRRGVKNIIIVDAEHDGKSKFKALKKLKRALILETDYKLELDESDICNVYDTDTSIVYGKVIDRVNKELISNVAYIKLSIDKAKMDIPCKIDNCYPLSVRTYYEKNSEKKISFPHNSTADIVYDMDQFRAYRDLGYFIGMGLDMENLVELKK